MTIGDMIVFTIENGSIHVTWFGFTLAFVMLLIIADAFHGRSK